MGKILTVIDHGGFSRDQFIVSERPVAAKKQHPNDPARAFHYNVEASVNGVHDVRFGASFLRVWVENGEPTHAAIATGDIIEGPVEIKQIA